MLHTMPYTHVLTEATLLDLQRPLCWIYRSHFAGWYSMVC